MTDLRDTAARPAPTPVDHRRRRRRPEAGRPGETLWLAIGATGRDPRQFAEPSRFDIGRSPNRHLQVGIGPHFCMGAALARAEIQLALAGLIARFRRIELATDEIHWHQNAVFRGPKAVPLAVAR